MFQTPGVGVSRIVRKMDVVVKSLCLEGPFLKCLANFSFQTPGTGGLQDCEKNGGCSKEFVFGGTIFEMHCKFQFPDPWNGGVSRVVRKMDVVVKSLCLEGPFLSCLANLEFSRAMEWRSPAL